MVGRDAAESIKIITRAASERIARFAFEYAVANGRRKVTAVHKANIMKLSDGLFLESCRTVAADYDGPDRVRGPHRRQHVHAARPEAGPVRRARPAEPLRRHRQRPVRRASSAASASRRAPTSATEAAVFEPVHGSAPKYAGLDKANPTALILSGALMLRHLGYPEAAERVETAVRDVIAEGRATTYDLGGDDRDAASSPTRSSSASARRARGTRGPMTGLPGAASALPRKPAGTAARGLGATSRRDRWWVAPGVQAHGLHDLRHVPVRQRHPADARCSGRRTRSTATSRRCSRR